jgi:hypothetical protein
MEHKHSKPETVKRRVALVQGESFRCVAVEIKPGRWSRMDDGTELPRVLEVLQVLDVRDSSVLGKPGK